VDRSGALAISLVLAVGCATAPGTRTTLDIEGTTPRPPQREPAFPPPAPDRPWVAIVIDDLGDSPAELRPFLDVPLPLSFAVLPTAAQARQVARGLVDLGRDVLVHVPMEPAETCFPLPRGTLLTSMDPASIRTASDLALSRVPGAIGANNHMGSAFTRSADALRPFVGALKDRGLFFLDSRTDPATVAEDVATAAGVPAMRRAVFLDNVDTPAAIDGMVAVLETIAGVRGCAVAIGHGRPGTAVALKRFATNPSRAVEVVPISRLVGRACATGAVVPGAAAPEER
jgi:polysaccharide deacetylase 2 family uncharacterized protein YibQ